MLGLSVSSTGLAAALPYVLSIVVKMLLGPISDKLSCISERVRVVMFATISQVTSMTNFKNTDWFVAGNAGVVLDSAGGRAHR